MPSYRRIARQLLLAAFVTVLPACTVLAPQPDTTRFFLLSPAPADQNSAAQGVNPNQQLALGIGPISFPDYLKRPEVVSRVSTDRLKLSSQDRWAEPLDVSFASVLGQDLSRILHTQRIVLFPWFGAPHLDYQVEVQVQRFDPGPDNQAHLVADWTIKDGGGATLYWYRTVVNSPLGAEDSDIPAALSVDLGTLSEQIASTISRLSQEHGTSTSPQ